jgi:carboxymethylenebutenolidase
MSLNTEYVHYGPGDEYGAYAAWPARAATPLPSVVVIQEIWGLDAHIEDVARRYALAGYVALAPDLYATAGSRPAPLARERVAALQGFLNQLPPATAGAMMMDPGAREAELSKRPPEEAARLGETMGALFGGLASGSRNLDAYVPKLVGASAFLRGAFPASRGRKVGSVGFCMGGSLVGLLACHDPDLAAAAIFYGSGPAASLIPSIRCPVAGFYGALDRRVTDGVPAFAEAMRAAGKRFEYQVYEGALHAFFNDTRPSYQVDAARDAYARVLDLFRRELP